MDADLLYVTENRETGVRQRVRLVSLIEHTPGAPPYMGFPDAIGDGSVLIDIDTYTRPDGEHPVKISMFVQNTYQKTARLASSLFTWLVAQQ